MSDVNYGELDCKLSDYLATDGVIILTAMHLEDIVDDILKLVKESSYKNKELVELKKKMEIAREAIYEESSKTTDKKGREFLNKVIKELNSSNDNLFDEKAKCEEIEGVDEASVNCKCQPCKNRKLIEGVKGVKADAFLDDRDGSGWVHIRLSEALVKVKELNK